MNIFIFPFRQSNMESRKKDSVIMKKGTKRRVKAGHHEYITEERMKREYCEQKHNIGKQTQTR